MTRSFTWLSLAATAILCACSSSPPSRYFTLDDRLPQAEKPSSSPSVAVVRANVPDLIDRPQLVIHTAGNQVFFSEQYRWAEPLRQEIQRLMASDLGDLLHSSRVVALPVDALGFDVDFKLVLDVQRLDAVAGQSVDVDVLWRLEHRSGKKLFGRSRLREPLTGAEGDYAIFVTGQRRALRRVADDIAQTIAAYPSH